MEILWEKEGFQFGFKRWQGWAVSKVLWEWIPNVGSKAREKEEDEDDDCRKVEPVFLDPFKTK